MNIRIFTTRSQWLALLLATLVALSLSASLWLMESNSHAALDGTQMAGPVVTGGGGGSGGGGG